MASIVRKPADDIAERRRHVRQLDLMGSTPAGILEIITREMPQLIADQKAPYQTIIDDLKAIHKSDQAEVREVLGLPVLTQYVGMKREILRQAMIDHQNAGLTAQARMRALMIASDATDDIARALGVRVDSPPFFVNMQQAMLDGGQPEIAGLLTPGGPPAGAGPGGQVDALTFATDPAFCGLGNITRMFPMQEAVLVEFMNPTNGYRTLILVCGMRSGKGVIGSVVVWYAVYQLLALADPQAYYGLAPNQEIQIVNLAPSERQARNNVFKHIKDRLDTGGDWFAQLRPQAQISGLEIRLPKNIVIRCGHSKATSQVGATSFMVILDELARFKDTEGRDNADTVYDQMGATTATFKDAGRVLVLSSPEWERDKAMRLLEDALKVDAEGRQVHPRMFGLQLATWEANKNFTQDQLWEMFDGESNPRAFWRDFGARPPTAREAYYPDPARWDRQPDPDRRHPYTASMQLEDWFLPCCPSKRFVHVDLGITRDACGLAMAHKPVPGCPWHAMVNGEANPKARKIVVDVALQIRPPARREEKGEISFEYVRQLIRDWQDRKFNVKGGRVTYDGWQSLDSLQQFRHDGYRVGQFSLDRDTLGHDTLQELINTDQVSFYAYEPLQREAKALNLVRGKKVDHPDKGSKDVVDAVAGAVYGALKLGGKQEFVG